MIVLDIETTGLDAQDHAIVSLGAVEFENPENHFYEECQIFTGALVDQAALDVHGMGREEITDPKKLTAKALLKQFSNWTMNCEHQIVAGHNVHFDLGFIEENFRRFELENILHKRVIDTHSLAWMHHIQNGLDPTRGEHSKLTSSYIFKYVGITEERGDHNALEDAKLTAEAISRLLYDEKLLADYREFAVPWTE